MTSARPVTSRATLVLAPNPGPMTLEGTNTWVLREPGADRAIVVDPGPDHPGHLRAVVEAAEAAGARIALVVLTHGHPDHAEGARSFAGLTRAPVRALDPRHRLGAEGLDHGDVLAVDGLEVRVVHTPGHTDDSLSFVVPGPGSQSPAVLTGDTVLGRGTTVVAHPEGRLADYLESLRRLRELGSATVLPGHGPVLPHAGEAAERYLAHRRERLEQVRAAAASGAHAALDVVRIVYADVDPALWPAAVLSVRAQLDYLREAPGNGRGPFSRTSPWPDP